MTATFTPKLISPRFSLTVARVGVGTGIVTIVLARGEYSAAPAGDAPPYSLAGKQILQGDTGDASGVVIVPGALGGYGNGVIFAGERNGVDHCTFRGPSGVGLAGISILSQPAAAASPHFVTNSAFVGTSIGIWVQFGAAHIEANTFEHLNSAIQWDPPDSLSQLVGNSFTSNGDDVVCTAGSSPSLTGHGNIQPGAGGASPILCYGCYHCAF